MSSSWPSLYPEFKVKKLFPYAKLPVRANPTDSGLDVFAYKFEDIYCRDGKFSCDVGWPRKSDLPPNQSRSLILETHCRVLINCGISVSIPDGYEIHIRPKSGLGLKKGMKIHWGTLDSSYRGPVCVLVFEHYGEIILGDKIAQLVIAPVCLSQVVEVEDLDDTHRGSGGFGSTGNT